MQTTSRHFDRSRRRPGRRPARLAALLLATAPFGLLAQEQDAGTSDPLVPLDEFVVSASRSTQDPWFTPSAVTRIDPAALDNLQIEDLRGALAREPGVIVVNTGATGGQSSVFMRGASGHQTLFVVDGVRMNDRAAAYANFLGGAGLTDVGRLEVLRGPQSTLYGSSAMGGIVLMETARASRGLRGSLAVTAGSFHTAGGGASIEHGSERFGITAAAARLVTGNDRPGNHFKGTSIATRIEGRPLNSLQLGVTYRGDLADYEEPGSRLFPAPGLAESRNHLVTAYAQIELTDSLSSRVTAGLHRRNLSFAADWGTSTTRNVREILDVQNTWTATPAIELVFGTNIERSKYEIANETSRDDLFGGYISAVARPHEKVALTAGGRYDDFESVGGAGTWRTGASWLVLEHTKLRATFGTGFSAPGSDDRFGVAQWGQLANPGIAPEKSRGWDIGIDHEMFHGNLTASATWFRNTFRNLFEWQTVDFTTFEGRIVNRARASTEGFELALAGRFSPAVHARLAYTYLDARNDSDSLRLIRRPRHTLDTDVTIQASRSLMVGAGLRAVADREDTAGPIEDYTTVRLHATWSVRQDLRLRLRMENALDESYEEVLGYPTLPRGIFGSAEWMF